MDAPRSSSGLLANGNGQAATPTGEAEAFSADGREVFRRLTERELTASRRCPHRSSDWPLQACGRVLSFNSQGLT